MRAVRRQRGYVIVCFLSGLVSRFLTAGALPLLFPPPLLGRDEPACLLRDDDGQPLWAEGRREGPRLGVCAWGSSYGGISLRCVAEVLPEEVCVFPLGSSPAAWKMSTRQTGTHPAAPGALHRAEARPTGSCGAEPTPTVR